MKDILLFTGDTHGEIDIHKLNNDNFPLQKTMNKNDYVVIAGDFGLIWDNSKQCKYWLKWLENRNFTTLFVDGNHENFDLLNAYPTEAWNGGEIHRITNSIIHLKRGQVFEIEGKTIFTFGGAKSHDKQYRILGKSWWEEEIPYLYEYDEALKNLSRYNFSVDIIVSHTCPTLIVKRLGYFNVDDDTSEMLEQIQIRTKFDKWFFGHFHVDRRLGDGFIALYNDIIEYKGG